MIIIFDPQREDWARMAQRLQIAYVRKHHLRLNPLQPPPGCAPEAWFQAIAFVFCQAFGLMTASFMLMVKLLLQTYRTLREEGRFPTPMDLIEAYRRYRAEGEEKLYKSRTLPKLEASLMAFPELDYEVGFDLSYFIRNRRSVIWQAPDDEDIRGFFILYQLYYLYHYLSRNRQPRSDTIYVVLDECLHIFRARDMQTGLDLATKLVTQLRGLGVSLIVLTQLPSQLSHAARANLNVVCSFTNQAQEVWATHQIQNLSDDQMEEIPNLPTGQCIMTIAGERLSGAVLVDTPLYPGDSDVVTDEDLDRISERSVGPLLDGTKKRDREPALAERRTHDPNRLPADQFRGFKAIHDHPEPIESRCARLGWDRDREYDAREGLQKRGFIQLAGRIGNKRKIFTPTPTKGEAFARKAGWTKPSFKSGPLHEAVVQALKISIANSLKNVRIFDKGFADILGGIQPDLVLQFSGGQLALVQVCDRNRAAYECKRLGELCRIDVVDLVISVSVNRSTREKVEKELTRQLGKVWPPKLIVMDVEPCLSPGYDWSWIMEKGA